LPAQAVQRKIDAKVGGEQEPTDVLYDNRHLRGFFIVLRMTTMILWSLRIFEEISPQ
jgi:hypothetical protein